MFVLKKTLDKMEEKFNYMRVMKETAEKKYRSLLLDYNRLLDRYDGFLDKYDSLEEKYTSLSFSYSNLRKDINRGRYKDYVDNQSKNSCDNKSQFSKAEIKDMIKLCHPDKHGNALIATELTKKLLSLR